MDALSPFPWFDTAVIVLLIVLNGVFAMSELAIVSARTARLQTLAKGGGAGAKTAMKLAADPGKFLSTVQIGITLIGILAGAYSGASLGGPVGERLALLGIEPGLAATLGFALVIGLTTYASLVVGELAPKQIALRFPERIAIVMAIPMDWMARATAPVVWLLDRSSALIFRLIGLRRKSERAVTAEELQMIFAEATKSGVIEESERAIISGVVRLADRPVREIMTPRTEVEWINLDAEAGEVRARLLDAPHSRLPLARGSVDEIIGVVQVREALAALAGGAPLDLKALARKADIIPDQVDAMDALKLLQKSDTDMALVHDEYGHFEGLVTPGDLIEALAGDVATVREDGTEPYLVMCEDGSMLVSGAMPADALAERLDIALPEDRDYATVAGHALELLRRIPNEGDVFADQGWRYEILDMDGRKIDKLLVSRETPVAAED